MNKIKATLLGVLIWVIITIIYSSFDANNNQHHSIGFPFPFYNYFAGNPGNSDVVAGGVAFSIDFISLILDLFFAAVFIFLLNLILVRLFKPSKTNSIL
ncbi:hypothetical protein [Mucilaginibacter phyllosphaerae]